MPGRFEGKARARGRRREPALDRLGDRGGACGRGAKLAFTYQGERIEKSVPELARRRHEARDGVRRPLGRRPRPGLRGDRRGVRRRARPARPLGRLRRGGGPRGPVHGHAARPLLDGRRHQRVLPGGVRPASRAADGEAGRGSHRDHDVPRRRARRTALQRDGRREGDAGCLDALPGLGPRARSRSASTRSRPARCGRSPRARSPASRRWRRCSSSARRSTATSTRATAAPAAAYLLSDDARNVSGTMLYVDAGYHAMGM